MRGRNFLRYLLLLCCLAGLAAPVHGQTASLVADLNPGVWESAPPPASHLFAAAGKLFFVDDNSGAPAVVDAAGTGSTLLAALCPDCGSSQDYLGSVGNAVLFATDLSNGSVNPLLLYRTDGTRAGTFSLGTFTRSDFGRSTVFAGNLFFFLHCDSNGGCEPWRTDGTLAGTRRIKDLAAGGQAVPRVDTLTAVGRRVFFFLDLNGSRELWASDGSEAGTTRVPGNLPSAFKPAGGSSRFYFVGDTGGGIGSSESFLQLWGSDGTAAGTRQLTHFESPGGLIDSTFQVLGDSAYVVANDVLHGEELWTSDGTPAGTRRVTDFGFFTPFQNTALTLRLLALGNRLVFPATDGLHGTQLWTTTGTPESTTPIGPAPSAIQRLVPVAGGRAVFFIAGTHDVELWGTDGTPQGTRRLPLPCAGCTLLSTDPIPLQGRAFFLFANQGASFLGTTDGTPAGTRRFGDPLPSAIGTNVGDLAMLSGRLFFTLSMGDPTYRLWTSDGQPGGTHAIPGLDSGGSSNPSDLLPQAGQLVFSACDGKNRQIWRTAGTPSTTERLTDLTSSQVCFEGAEPVGLTATASRIFFLSAGELWSLSPTGEQEPLAQVDFSVSNVPKLVPLGERIYFFFLPSGGNKIQLWQSDGTAAGTGPATGLAAVPNPTQIDRIGGTLYLQGSSDADNELWASDGTVAGTRRLLVTRDHLSEPFGQAGPWVFFVVELGLWRTDGTAAGTALVRDLTHAGFNSGLFPADPVEYGGALYFFADTAGGRGLFRSDGTAAGTGLMREFRSELDDSLRPVPSRLTVFAGRLFFAADDGIHGRELWTSDGTAAGTVLVADVNPGPESSHTAELTVAGGRLYFSAYDPVHGVELWQSDGNVGDSAGTRLALDLAPESASSNPRHLTALGNRLYFAADDGISGNELWTIDTAAPAGCQPGDTRLCLAGGRFQVEVDWKDFQGHTGVGHAAPLTADTGTFWFFAQTNVELVVKVLDARALNNAFWVFYGALSSVDYTITVTDTATGLSRRYHNPSGQLASVGDTNGFGPLGAFDAKTFETPASALPLVAARTDPRAATGSCAAGPGRLCLAGSRFALTAAWKDFQGHTGTGTAVSLTGDTGYFWFFSPTNVEVVAKVLDGQALNGKFWVFYGALSNVEYTLTVTDTQTGAVKTYKNPSGQFGSVGDTGAFR